MDVGQEYLSETAASFRTYRKQAELALAQVGDDAFTAAPDPESNSIAIIVKHVGGNLRSRWTDFLDSDGEKPDRDRDREFEGGDTRDALMALWEEGWSALFGTLEVLNPADLQRTVHIRDEKLLVVEALNRSVTHTAYHVGQIVYVARHLASGHWTSLSIPKIRPAEAGIASSGGELPRS